ncbi:GntR family transcriptional regulator [Dongia mobilis]|uniref:GntR family transcriptional regulator n=1 Tax=Dongia mobilis TaxID=578943 RepID=A0A4R6X318_9PROT|nr:GntR family transcriptional regulator [Dongia mobilis]
MSGVDRNNSARARARAGRALPPKGAVAAQPARSSLHRSVAQDIGARILKGEFAPGTLLPNEAEWCEKFGVSRTAVREAIKMLMAKGLIQSRPKIGSRVLPRAQWNLLDRDVLAWYCAAANPVHFLIHMQQVREILEPETAALAAANRNAEQMAEIEAAFLQMAEAKTLSAWNYADARFHQAILLAAGNELLVPLGLVIESALENMFTYTASQRGDIGRTLPGHRKILLAIRAQKPEAARQAVRSLLRDTRRIVNLVASSRTRPASRRGRA